MRETERFRKDRHKGGHAIRTRVLSPYSIIDVLPARGRISQIRRIIATGKFLEQSKVLDRLRLCLRP
jgi:hypothetical protein